MAATDQIENAIRSMLNAGGGITGVPSQRVTHAYRAPLAALPSVTYDVVSIEDACIGGPTYRMATVEYRAVAETVLAALDIIDLVRAKNVATTVGTIIIRTIVWQNRVAEPPQVTMGDEAAPAEVVATAQIYYQG
jgi:hypothetical protein